MALPDGLFICRTCPGSQNRRKQYKNDQNDWYKALNEFTFDYLTWKLSYTSILVVIELYYCTRPTPWLTVPRKFWIPTSTWAFPKRSLLGSIYVIYSICDHLSCLQNLYMASRKTMTSALFSTPWSNRSAKAKTFTSFMNGKKQALF